MYEGNKENWTKEWGEDWNKTQKVMNDLAIAIAKGEVQTDEESLIDWLWDKETYMYDYADFDYSAFE